MRIHNLSSRALPPKASVSALVLFSFSLPKTVLNKFDFAARGGPFPAAEKTNIVIMVITSICLARQTATGPFERASVIQRRNLILIHESSVMHISVN